MPEQDVVKICALIEKKEISYVCSVVESYDYLAVTRTIDKDKGIVQFLISPSFVDEMMGLLGGLEVETGLRLLCKHIL